MKAALLTAAMMTALVASTPANAVGVQVGAVNTGPQAPVGFDALKLYATFDAGAPAGLAGGSLHTGSNDSLYAAPFGDATQYYAVGPEAGSPAKLAISNFDRLSFYWGSIDYYNTFSFLGAGGSVLQSFTGSQIIGGTPIGAESRTVTFTLSPIEAAAVTGIQFSSTVNAFEFDNLAIGSVPEPAVWLSMLLGIGLVGGVLRQRRARTVRVAYA